MSNKERSDDVVIKTHDESRTYLASDLAGELGLPRSTINDWLTRKTQLESMLAALS